MIFAIHTDLVEKLQQGKALLAQVSGQSHRSGAGMNSIVLTKSLEPATSRVRRTDHWVLVSSIKITAKNVTVKLYSWKDSMTGTFDTSTFLTCYDGSIVAEPPRKISIKPISTEGEWSDEDESSDQ